ncbi:unnamed protein product [Polarella glacialis]|uniref:Uncharacterized protein n=1 Tax=Polarella glacialis TaxID=89957 RepID=A0A813HQI6_POLGL|nr:unnamed protein product [Polarella glacialis]
MKLSFGNSHRVVVDVVVVVCCCCFYCCCCCFCFCCCCSRHHRCGLWLLSHELLCPVLRRDMWHLALTDLTLK